MWRKKAEDESALADSLRKQNQVFDFIKLQYLFEGLRVPFGSSKSRNSSPFLIIFVFVSGYFLNHVEDLTFCLFTENSFILKCLGCSDI